MQRFTDRLTTGLVLVCLAILAPLACSLAFPSQAHQVYSNLMQAIGEAWIGVKLLFGVVLVLGTAWGVVKVVQTWQVKEIGPDKQAVIYKGALIQLQTQLLGTAQQDQLAQVKQIIQAAELMARYAKHLPDETPAIESGPDVPKIEAPRNADDLMYISPSYALPADTALSGRKLIIGVSGSGKSNSIGVYGEELGRLRVPFVIADTENEYPPLCKPQWLPSGVLVGAQSVTVENAYQFGRYILDHNLQVILNLQSYEFAEAAQVMVKIIAGMRDWQEERENELRIPCDFILEEAVTWLPQYIKESPLHSSDPETLAALQGTFFNDMVRKGRKRGLGLTLVCQKIAELDNRAMQSDTKWLHRQTEEADLERYRKFGISREEALNLADGEAYLFTSQVHKMRIQIRKRHSPHGANTPGMANLRRYQAENSGEIGGNFGRNIELPDKISGDFEEPGKPFQNISEFRKPANSTPIQAQREVPEMLKREIIQRYTEGMKRTQIRDDLDLNGDQYWMVRMVCDEYDQLKQAGEL